MAMIPLQLREPRPRRIKHVNMRLYGCVPACEGVNTQTRDRVVNNDRNRLRYINCQTENRQDEDARWNSICIEFSRLLFHHFLCLFFTTFFSDHEFSINGIRLFAILSVS